ncbi:MAG: hypothetical protein ACLFN8_02890 [Candidatus Woesearchaeota archaeon]
MKFNKKAAMELGISTVVMLVIAIVIIGGGIVFIRGFFDKGTGSLDNAFDLADFGMSPTPTDPLVLIDGTINIKTGKTELVRVGFYNKQGDNVPVSIGFGNCITTVNTDTACGAGNNPKPSIRVLPEEVDVGASAPFGTQITAVCDNSSSSSSGGNLPAGLYTCSLVAFECADNGGGSNVADNCIGQKFNSSVHEVLERTQVKFNVLS